MNLKDEKNLIYKQELIKNDFCKVYLNIDLQRFYVNIIELIAIFIKVISEIIK